MGQKNCAIICLAAKRSGTSATHRIFVSHPQAKIINPDQDINNNEPNFWNYAMTVLDDPEQIVDDHDNMVDVKDNLTAYERFVLQLGIIAPHISVPAVLTEEIVFDLWDDITNHYGPICFDKSPRYLEDIRTLELIYKYKESGRGEIRFFGIMRAPWDVITSEVQLWEHILAFGTPQYHEQEWLTYYKNFEKVQAKYGVENVPLFYYEQMSNFVDLHLPRLLKHCGLDDIPESYSQFYPVSIGRYYKSPNPRVLAWEPTEELMNFANRHGFYLLPSYKRFLIRAQVDLKEIIRRLKRFRTRVYYKLRLMMKSDAAS